jgi:hypothetical protein
MRKTTIYLPDELKAGLERVSEVSGRSEAELIREAVGELVQRSVPPRPRLPLFASGDPELAERVAKRPEEELAGFGETGSGQQ